MFIKRLAVLLLVSTLLAVISRVLLFSTFVIPSESMEPTLKGGDFVLVNKLIPGPRIFKNILNSKNDPQSFWRILRLGRIERNDIAVFNPIYEGSGGLKMNINSYLIKRCIALPGDSVAIRNGFYEVNGLGKVGNYKEQLKLSKIKDSVLAGWGIYRSFPWSKVFHWNIKNFGPLYVPKAQDNILLNPINIKLYRNAIWYETGKKITQKGDTILLNQEIIKSYKFLCNYYFMGGDHVLSSDDSRYWGLLPESSIIGKAQLILTSKDPETGSYRSERFLNLLK